MTHRLGLQELRVVRRLQSAGLELDLRREVLSPSSPLLAAVKGMLLLHSGSRITTVVVDDHSGGHHLHGFAQARDRAGRPEQDIVYVAPLLSSGNGIIWTWQRLLGQIRTIAGERGIQRVFTQLDDDRPAEIEVFRQAGFSIYTKDRIFRLGGTGSRSTEEKPASWRPMRPGDMWGLSKLTGLLVPTVVQQAEVDTASGSKSAEEHGRWHVLTSRSSNFVLEAEDQEIAGHLRLWKGQRGYWIKLVLHPQVYDQADSLLREGLALLPTDSQIPVYCDVRDYEAYVTSALGRAGFESVAARVLMVKSLTISIREPRRILVPALERSAGQVPTASSQQTE